MLRDVVGEIMYTPLYKAGRSQQKANRRSTAGAVGENFELIGPDSRRNDGDASFQPRRCVRV